MPPDEKDATTERRPDQQCNTTPNNNAGGETTTMTNSPPPPSPLIAEASKNNNNNHSTTSSSSSTTTDDVPASSTGRESDAAAATTNNEQLLPHPALQRFQSAEEVYEEALNYERSSASASSLSSIVRDIGNRSLYPSLDKVHAADCAVEVDDIIGKESKDEEEEEEKREIDDDDDDDEQQRNYYLNEITTTITEVQEIDQQQQQQQQQIPETAYAAVASLSSSFASASASAAGVAFSSTEEATVLDDEGNRILPYNENDDDDPDLVAMKRMAYEGGGGGGWRGAERVTSVCDTTNISNATAVAASVANAGQQATVVSITEDFVHPSDPSIGNAVTAELIGEEPQPTNLSSHHGIGGDQEEDVATTTTNAYTPVVDAATRVEEAATEATVIDSGPNDLWECTEEAQVLEENSDAPPIPGQKVESDIADIDGESEVGAVVAFSDQEAEVLGIQEDVHPFEFEVNNDAQAVHVGTDYSVSVGVAIPATPPSAEAEVEVEAISEHPLDNGLPPISSPPPTINEVTMISGESGVSASEVHGTAEVHATLVHRDYSTSPGNNDATTRQTTSATITNPSEDDPNDPPTVPRDAISQLDSHHHQQQQQQQQQPGVRVNAPLAIAFEDMPPPATTLPTTTSEPTVAASSGKALDEEGEQLDASIPDWLRSDTNAPGTAHSPPPPRPFGSSPIPQATPATAGHRAVSSGGGTACSERTLSSIQSSISTNLARGTGNVMEALFGDTKPPFMNRKTPLTDNQAANSLLPRTLLPWSVIYSQSTGMWVCTLQTNQKALDSNDVAEASKSLRAFSLPTEKQALALAKAWTPPRMANFDLNPSCHICFDKFAVFRRAKHCRNCGVCVCSTCSTSWPSKMIPETYNRKNEANVNVCKTCDWLCHQFRIALLEGNFDQAVALYSTCNVNINSPFGNVKGELLYPVHAACHARGSLKLLKWLVEEHCCPIKSVRVSGTNKNQNYTPIITSKGRSLLGIAMENSNTPIVRYLVVEKRISIAGEKDITPAMLMRNLELALRLLPEDDDCTVAQVPSREEWESSASRLFEQASAPLEEELEYPDLLDANHNVRTLSEEATAFGAVKHEDDSEDDKDLCILCFDNKIDCVSNPCGHQIMCMKCSENISRCPVCAGDCTFIRVFKP